MTIETVMCADCDHEVPWCRTWRETRMLLWDHYLDEHYDPAHNEVPAIPAIVGVR